MFQKRRSMLGRRHLIAQQQAQERAPPLVKPLVSNGSGNSGGSSHTVNTSWRGRRSGKKKTPSHFDKAEKEFKKKLFYQSPGVNYVNTNTALGRDGIHQFLNANFLNETGISSIPATPSSSSRLIPVTPATAQQRRIDAELSRYQPLPTASRFERVDTKFKTESVDQSYKISSSYSYQKPTTASCDFDNLKPPDSPGPSRLDRIILEEKLEQPKDPDDLKKIQSLNLQDPNTCLQFSPPLSSTCIGSPDSGSKNVALRKEIKESVQCSGKKLSIIQEDCDSSVIEFEENERTITELDEVMKDSTLNNTLKVNNATCLETILEDHNSNLTEECEQNWESVILRLHNMERAVNNRNIKTKNDIQMFKKYLEKVEKDRVRQFKEDIDNIRSMKEMVKSLRRISVVECSTENKENTSTFFSTCKKKQLDEESKWFNTMKDENPGLLKTPNPNRRIKQSSTWTPHSLSKALHDQMSELYD